MVCYSLDTENPTESCKSRSSNLRVHFRNICETAQAVEGVHIQKATKYLNDVTVQKQCALFPHYNCGAGRGAQAKHTLLQFGGWT